MRGHTSECGDLGVRLCLCGSDRFFFLVVLVYYNYCTIVLQLGVCMHVSSRVSLHSLCVFGSCADATRAS